LFKVVHEDQTTAEEKHQTGYPLSPTDWRQSFFPVNDKQISLSF